MELAIGTLGDAHRPMLRILRVLEHVLARPMNESTCYDDCAAAWPPAVTSAEPAAGEGVDENMISTIERKDGSQQLTYQGRPLCYFTRDQQAGDVKGQNVDGFGGRWHMVSPEGEKVEGES